MNRIIKKVNGKIVVDPDPKKTGAKKSIATTNEKLDYIIVLLEDLKK